MFTPQDFKSMYDHFSLLYMKWLSYILNCTKKNVLKILFVMNLLNFLASKRSSFFIFIITAYTSNGMMQIAFTENFKSDK